VLAIGLGFRIFGLSPWAGRFPLALFGLAGLAALFFLVERLSSRRIAWLSVLALSTMPLYFLQARTLLGDIVTLAAALFAWAGLGVAVFDLRARRVRLWALALGLVGLLAGFWSRGLLVGVAAPTLAVGLAWLACALSGARGDRLSAALAATALFGGVSCALFGAWAVHVTPADGYSIWVGATTGGAFPVPTFDVIARELGHALFPWSAVIPPALGRALDPPAAARGEDGERDHALRLLALSAASVTFIVQTALAPEVGLLPYAAPGALAVLCAIALSDLERGARASRAFALAVGALGILLLLDFRNFPEKGLVAFSAEGAVFPQSFASLGFRWLATAGLGFVLAFFFIVQERAGRARLGVFRAGEYARWPRILHRQWAGNLWFAVLVVECALMGFELILVVSDRALHLPAFEALGEMPRLAVRAGWVLGLAFCLTPVLVLVARDLSRLLLRHFPARGASAVVVVALAGASLGFGYYPALMQQISPKRSFDAYRRLARAGEPLGLLGSDAAVARYQAGVSARELADVDHAIDWLLSGRERRFIALRSAELASLNAAYRARHEPRANLPVIDADSSEILLAASRLPDSERNQNPLMDFVLDRAPTPGHPLDVNLAGKLSVLGWDVTDGDGARVDIIAPGERYELAIYYRVDARVSGTWEAFVHVDGFQRRYNADHALLAGRYPLTLWLPGDFIVDRTVLRLEPNFAPGTYRVLFGLYSGERRLEVRSGKHEENRIVAGTLIVK
jgi:hypothetical protein